MKKTLVTQQTRTLREAWRQAYRQGQIIIELPSERDAKRLRFTLYDAVKPVRDGELVDAELLEAVSTCSLQIRGSKLIIENSSQGVLMQATLAAIGKSVEEVNSAPDPLTEEEIRIQESLARTLKLLEEPAPEHTLRRANPYYTRED